MSASFDLHTEQGKWRRWDELFKKVFDTLGSTTKGEDYSQKTVLDIGCATGWSSHALANRFGRVVGVDADASLIERAKQASMFSPNSKKLVFERAEDLATWDAFGERFDMVFSGYTLAYLGDVTPVLRHWASLLKPGGILVVLEIQGLFAVHSPLGQFKVWFEKFDREVLKGFGYTSNAGTQMCDALPNLPELQKIAFDDWQDAELSFNGPLEPGSPVYLGWEERWKRLWPLMTALGSVEEGLHDAFFSCLSSPEHKSEKPVKLLICSRTLLSPTRPDVTLRSKETSGEEDEVPNTSIAGGSGGPDGGDD